jgi:hypothetical protein
LAGAAPWAGGAASAGPSGRCAGGCRALALLLDEQQVFLTALTMERGVMVAPVN